MSCCYVKLRKVFKTETWGTLLPNGLPSICATV